MLKDTENISITGIHGTEIIHQDLSKATLKVASIVIK